MYSIKEVKENLYYLGVNDRRLELFENLFPIPNGVTYNSYLLTDEKTVLFDTVDGSVAKQFNENLTAALNGRTLDYLIVNHMEPDHSETIRDIVKNYPDVTIVGNAKTMPMIKAFGVDVSNTLVVKENDILETGTHKLTFVMAPMVHWPEVMVTYDITDKVLFSADAFGTFGALDGRIFADEYDFDRDFIDDARRYYTNIVGKYGAQTNGVLKKASGLDIEYICPLHGPVWRKDLGYFVDKHQKWATYTPENPDEVLMVYGSMYGNTESVVNAVAMKLSENGKKVKIVNACNTDVSYLVAEAFRCGNIVIASPTYNAGIYPAIDNFITHIKDMNLQNRKIYLIENSSWAPIAAKKMTEAVSTMKNTEVLATLSIKSSLNDISVIDDFVAKF